MKATRMMKGSPKLEGPQIVDQEENESGEPHEYEIADAVRTMQQADKIKKDPKMMKHVHKHVSKQITSLKGLKKLAGQKAMEEADLDHDGM